MRLNVAAQSGKPQVAKLRLRLLLSRSLVSFHTQHRAVGLDVFVKGKEPCFNSLQLIGMSRGEIAVLVGIVFQIVQLISREPGLLDVFDDLPPTGTWFCNCKQFSVAVANRVVHSAARIVPRPVQWRFSMQSFTAGHG